MKKLYSLSLLLILSLCIYSQEPCQWAHLPSGSNAYNSDAMVATDSHGNIIQAGKILGIADMDPGTGPGDTVYSPPGYNYFLSKTSNDGHLKWIKYFSGNPGFSFFEFVGVQVNSSDEIVVAGNFYGVVDFDLSVSGVDTLRSHFPTYPDYFVVKYDSTGALQFAFNIGNVTTNNIEAQSLHVGRIDNIYISANPSSNFPLDVDPGPGVHNTVSGNGNIICYDANGNYLWNNQISTTYSYGINGKSLATDANGNSYLLTVGYYELSVNKFSSSGAWQWEKTIGDFSSQSRVTPLSVLVDKFTGDFYVAGTFLDTVDFDPGNATVNRISSSGFFEDGFIARYDSSMNLIWVNTYSGNVVFGNSSLDFSGTDIVAVGNFKGTIDFGNGLILSSAAQSFSPMLIKLNAAGTTMSGYALNGMGNYNTINVTNNQSYIISGMVNSAMDIDPTATTYNLTPGNAHYFYASYGQVSTFIKDNNSSKTLFVYPNPVADRLYVHINSVYNEMNFTLTDVNGRSVKEGKLFEDKNFVDLSELSSGIYFLLIDNESKNSFKVVKE